MAKISFQTIGTTDYVNIYVRISIERGKQFRRKTGYSISPKDWIKGTQQPKIKNSSKSNPTPNPKDEKLKKLKIDLDRLKISLEERINDAVKQGVGFSADWLQTQIDEINGKKKKTDPDRLVNHFQSYIDYLPYKRDSRQKKPVSAATIKKYATIKNKVIAFEEYRKQPIYIKNVDLNFRKEFIKYLAEVENLSDNTIGRYITFIKTVCNDAKIHGIETNIQLDAIKGFTEEAAKIHFTFDELDQIENAPFTSDSLDNAKDWLIIGCYIGQRVSDLLHLTKDNICYKNGIELIELTQKKTGKQIFIPIHPKVVEILNKRDGQFPRRISAQKFNLHIKNVSKLAKINAPTEGAKMDEVTKRKKSGVYPKWELVTSHICRRSFASNYYGLMPTPLIITITGHSTESQFLEYVGKPPIDHAQQIAEYLNLIYQKQQNKPHLMVKKAN